MRLRPILIPMLAAVALTAVTACEPIVRRHGYIPDEDELMQFVPGVDTRDSVLEQLPPPSAAGTVKGGNVYYVQSRFRTIGPFEPKEVDREVVAITFDAAGTVTGIERFGLEDGRVVALSRRVTDDNIADVSFLRQLMGNIGRFDAGALLGGN